MVVDLMGGGASTELGGVRVFKVHPGSPAVDCGLEVFFDLIVEVNGTRLEPNCQTIFAEKIKEAKNCAAKLTVFNLRANTTREVTVVPREWAGSGLLGATVRYDVVDPAENQGIRVLEVFPNSPAAHAGLIPFQDYLLGTALAVFHDIDELIEEVTSNINKRMQIYVYNADSETVREVTIAPNNDWGGDGCIGCDIGTGMFHKMPPPRRLPVGNAPGPSAAQAGAPPVPGLPPPAYPPGAALPQGSASAAKFEPAATALKVPDMPGALAAAPVPPGAEPGRLAVQWPPPEKAGADGGEGVAPLLVQEQTDAATPTAALNHLPPPSEGPRAPPGSPLDLNDTPAPPVDLSAAAAEAARFAGMSSPSPGASPVANQADAQAQALI